MLRNTLFYIALALFSVSCGGNAGDESQAVDDEAGVAAADAAAVVVADTESAAVANDEGKALYAPCVACHGVNGEGNMALNSPGIAGQSESYLMRQLWDFKKGNRGAKEGDLAGAQMRPMAMGLADGVAIAKVSAYIASLPATTPPATVDGDPAIGKKQYISKCGACHGGDAWGNEALYTPRLTMIGDAYMIRQVDNFKSGVRGAFADASYGQQMAMIAKTVSEEELRDIAAYLNELAATQ
jgi:cytochrome c553